MTQRIVLLYDSACPNVEAARTNLTQALRVAGLDPGWDEVDLAAEDTPDVWRCFGSPTVLVNGRDVAGAEPEPDAGCSCRLYEGGGGAPTVEVLVAALRQG